MAKEVGAFDKYGIPSDIIFISSGPVVVQALIGGDLQGGSGASNAVINAVLNGAPIVAVAATANRPYHRLYVQPEINRLEDLKGKTLGVTRFGSITDNLTRILLRKSRLGGSRQRAPDGRHHRSRRGFPKSPDCRRRHRRSARRAAESAEDSGQAGRSGNSLFDEHDRGLARLFAAQSDTVERMVRAYAEGVAAMNQKKERALKVIAKYARIADAKGIENHYRDSVTYLDRIPRAEPEAVQTILEFMGKKGVPTETFQDNSIIDKLNRKDFSTSFIRNRSCRPLSDRADRILHPLGGIK